MSQPPPTTPQSSLRSALIGGGALAAAAIGLFVLLWIILGQTGVTSAQRLFISLCIPPALLAGSIGAFILLRRPPR